MINILHIEFKPLKSAASDSRHCLAHPLLKINVNRHRRHRRTKRFSRQRRRKMEKKTFKSMVIIAALAFLMGMAPFAVAQDTAQDDDTQQSITTCPRGEMRGMGKFQRGNGKGLGASESLSEEQIEKLQAQRSAFQTATQDLRMELQSKRLALKSELAKKEPDVKAAKSLQKEISALNAELAQNRIEHVLEMKKINPYASMGLMKNSSDGVETGRNRRNI
jgi:Spy/CpxP family protein refolding chaperone